MPLSAAKLIGSTEALVFAVFFRKHLFRVSLGLLRGDVSIYIYIDVYSFGGPRVCSFYGLLDEWSKVCLAWYRRGKALLEQISPRVC